VLFEGLGKSWRIPEYSFKPYPCCRCNHTAIGIGIALHDDGVRAPQIASIEIGMGHTNWLTVGEPYDVKRDSVVHAQFNISYSFARALSDGRVDLRTYQEPAITDATIASLASRIRPVSDPAIDPAAIEPARVKISLTDGRVIERSADTIKGSPQAPMSEHELRGKFRSCLEFGLRASQAQCERLEEVVFSLEKSADAARDIVATFPT
jgi:2-methylcitrate dehydratase PrpD